MTDVSWLEAAAETFLAALKTVFPSGCDPQQEQADDESGQNGDCWRCPWNWQEIKGLLMQPAARGVAELSRMSASQGHLPGWPSLAAKNNKARSAWVDLIRGFTTNVQATRRARLAKTLEKHAAVLKRELKKETDVASERLERERGADDAEALLEELDHPAVGLGTSEMLAEEPALRRVVELVRQQVGRLRRGEVDKPAKDGSGTAAASVQCPHCGTELVEQTLRGNYCDSPDCGAPPSWRCPSPGCDFDLCSDCHDLATGL